MAVTTTTTAAVKAPFIPQDVSEGATMVRGRDAGRKPSGGSKKDSRVKRNAFDVFNSPDGIQMDS